MERKTAKYQHGASLSGRRREYGADITLEVGSWDFVGKNGLQQLRLRSVLASVNGLQNDARAAVISLYKI